MITRALSECKLHQGRCSVTLWWVNIYQWCSHGQNLKAKAFTLKAKACTFEAKAKATGPEDKAFTHMVRAEIRYAVYVAAWQDK